VVSLKNKCFDCGKEISHKAIRCQHCANLNTIFLRTTTRRSYKGKDNPNYILGTYTKEYYCKNCGNKISLPTKLYGLGYCRTCSNKSRTGEIHQEQSKRMSGKRNPNYGKVQKPRWGKYKNINMRSSWEVKYAKYLDKNNIKWEYEPETFDLGDTTYTPDFRLNREKYVEIKGYMSPESYFKIKKFILSNLDIDYVLLTKKDLIRKGVLE